MAIGLAHFAPEYSPRLASSMHRYASSHFTQMSSTPDSLRALIASSRFFGDGFSGVLRSSAAFRRSSSPSLRTCQDRTPAARLGGLCRRTSGTAEVGATGDEHDGQDVVPSPAVTFGRASWASSMTCSILAAVKSSALPCGSVSVAQVVPPSLLPCQRRFPPAPGAQNLNRSVGVVHMSNGEPTSPLAIVSHVILMP